jgi:hypothetical protein
MKKLIIITCCVVSLNHANAQDQPCEEIVIMNVKSKWTRDADNIVNPEKTFPSGQYNQLYTRLDKIAGLFQEAYPQPAGMQAKWYRSIRGAAMIKNGPVPYQFNSLYQGWYCNQNLHKLMLGSETGTWSFVYLNNFGWFMTDQNDKLALTIEGADAWLLPRKTGQWKGLSLYEPGAHKNDKIVLITRNNQLPYKPVSRLQFLQALKKKIEADKKIQQDINKKQPVRTDAEEEAGKQKELESIVKNNQPKYVEQRKASYLKNYKTDEQRKEETIQRAEDYFNSRLKPVNDELNNGSNNELQQPAIVDNNYMSFFKGFTTEEKGGRMIVLINADYFDLRLPRYVPQLIVLYWSWDKNGPALNFKNEFEENFPIEKLKAMIDK